MRQVVFPLCLGAMLWLGPAWAADDGPEGRDSWISLEQFLHQKTGKSGAAAQAGALLPSLLPPALDAAPQPEEEDEPFVQPVTFANLPPLFERPKAAPPPAAPPLKKTPPAQARTFTAEVAPPAPEKPADAACAAPAVSAMSKRAKALAGDSATLMALQQAVKDLKLDAQMDFLLTPDKASAPMAQTAGAPGGAPSGAGIKR